MINGEIDGASPAEVPDDGSADFLEGLTLTTVAAIRWGRLRMKAGEGEYVVRREIMGRIEGWLHDMAEPVRKAAVGHIERVLEEFFAEYPIRPEG